MNISIRYCSNIDIASWLINNIIKDINSGCDYFD